MLYRWISWAISSFPHPVSAMMRTGASVCCSRKIKSRISRISRLVPTSAFSLGLKPRRSNLSCRSLRIPCFCTRMMDSYSRKISKTSSSTSTGAVPCSNRLVFWISSGTTYRSMFSPPASFALRPGGCAHPHVSAAHFHTLPDRTPVHSLFLPSISRAQPG